MNLLVVGDAPNLPSGLGRIARDICKLSTAYGIQTAQLGLGYDGEPFPWPVFPVQDSENWAVGDVGRAWNWAFGDETGAILTVWDPVRCFPISQKQMPIGMQRWGYFAVDGHQAGGGLGMIAKKTLSQYDRVLGYTDYGAGVLKEVVEKPVQWLPHLLNDEFKFDPTSKRTKVGIVATNQPRKHWPMVFMILEYFQMLHPDLTFWIHTDKKVAPAWVFAELMGAYHIKKEKLEITTDDLEDGELARRYNECLITIAPGLGEGFGYPIVESLGCGTPVVAYAYAGGEELVPRQSWLIQPEHYVESGIYLIQRPHSNRQEILRAVAETLADARTTNGIGYLCEGSVRHLRWDVLAPRWFSWLRAGFKKED